MMHHLIFGLLQLLLTFQDYVLFVCFVLAGTGTGYVDSSSAPKIKGEQEYYGRD